MTSVLTVSLREIVITALGDMLEDLYRRKKEQCHSCTEELRGLRGDTRPDDDGDALSSEIRRQQSNIVEQKIQIERCLNWLGQQKGQRFKSVAEGAVALVEQTTGSDSTKIVVLFVPADSRPIIPDDCKVVVDGTPTTFQMVSPQAGLFKGLQGMPIGGKTTTDSTTSRILEIA